MIILIFLLCAVKDKETVLRKVKAHQVRVRAKAVDKIIMMKETITVIMEIVKMTLLIILMEVAAQQRMHMNVANFGKKMITVM